MDTTTKLTTRVLAMLLAGASFACRESSAQGAEGEQTSALDPAARQEKPVADAALSPAAPPAAPTPATVKPRAPKQVPGRAGFGWEGGQNAATFGRTAIALKGTYVRDNGAAVITTEPIDATTQSNWEEDLRVMDKLLRDKMQGNEGHAWVAMGILVNRMQPSATYVEGAGVILTGAVPWPLAADPSAGRDEGTGKRKSDSEWDRAKRQLKGQPMPEEMGMEGESAPPPVFDQKRLDRLVELIVETLPQASNFRHLKPEESVIVTVGGMDDAGKPVRLTVKARKSDIDEAAAGKLDAEAFKQRVTRRVG